MKNLQNKNEGWSDTYEILMSFFSEKKNNDNNNVCTQLNF